MATYRKKVESGNILEVTLDLPLPGGDPALLIGYKALDPDGNLLRHFTENLRLLRSKTETAFRDNGFASDPLNALGGVPSSLYTHNTINTQDKLESEGRRVLVALGFEEFTPRKTLPDRVRRPNGVPEVDWQNLRSEIVRTIRDNYGDKPSPILVTDEIITSFKQALGFSTGRNRS